MFSASKNEFTPYYIRNQCHIKRNNNVVYTNSNDNDIESILKKFITKINIENKYFIFLYFYLLSTML